MMIKEDLKMGLKVWIVSICFEMIKTEITFLDDEYIHLSKVGMKKYDSLAYMYKTKGEALFFGKKQLNIMLSKRRKILLKKLNTTMDYCKKEKPCQTTKS